MPFFEAAARIVGAIAALGLVLLLAYFLLHWLNKRMPGMSGGPNRLIQVLDRVAVGRGGSIMLLRVQDKVLLVAVTDKAVEKLCEFDDPEGKIAQPEPLQAMDFSAALKEAGAKFGLKMKKTESEESHKQPEQTGEEGGNENNPN